MSSRLDPNIELYKTLRFIHEDIDDVDEESSNFAEENHNIWRLLFWPFCLNYAERELGRTPAEPLY